MRNGVSKCCLSPVGGIEKLFERETLFRKFEVLFTLTL